MLPYLLLVALTMMSMGGIFTLLGEIRDELGFSELQLGLIVGVGFIMAFFAQTGLARWSDRGYASLMIRFGLVANTLALTAMALADGFWSYLLARMLLGVGVGSLIPAVRRIIILSDSENVGANIGRIGSFDVAGFMIGPLVSGAIAQFFGFRAGFWAFALISLAFWPTVLRLPADNSEVSTERRVITVLLKRRAIQAVLVSAIGWFAMIGVFETVWAVFLSDRGAELWFIGATMSIAMLPMLFLAPYVGSFAERRGALKVVILGVLFIAPWLYLYGQVTSLWVIAILVTIQGIGDAFVFPSTQVGVAVAAPPGLTASAQGLQGATLELVAGLTAMGAGLVYQTGGARAVFSGLAALMVLGALAGALIARSLPADHPVLGSSPPVNDDGQPRLLSSDP